MKITAIAKALSVAAAVCTIFYASAAIAQMEGGSAGVAGPDRSPFGSNLVGDAQFSYDPNTGTLMVITDPDTNREIERLIETLDKPVPQVLIKVLFLEVTHNHDTDIGIEFMQNLNLDTDIVGNIVRDENIGTSLGVGTTGSGALYTLLKNDLDLTVRALAEVGKLEVLSRPSILARNNEEALITVGQEVPFVRNTQITNEGNTINTVEYEDIGIILQVLPYINAEGLVELTVATEISTITGDSIMITAGVEAPVFAKRSAETNVVVPNGRTVVIGGLMEDNLTETVRKVPILGSIPILGFPFKRTIKTKSKTELLIFLTPHVVRGMDDLGQLSRSEHDSTTIVKKAFSEEQLNNYIGTFGVEEEVLEAPVESGN